MKKKNAPKNARRADGVLSPEELAKAIEEYKARRAQRLAAKTDEGDDTTDENNDEGDDDTDNQDSDDDPIPTATPADHTQGEVLNADGIDAIIRQRVKIGMIGKALNLDGVEDMSISAAKKAIIKAVRPEMRLDGKSDAFVNAAFEYAVADVESRSKKDVGYQKKQMFNRDSRTPVSNGVGSADSARQKMIERRQNRAKEEK